MYAELYASSELLVSPFRPDLVAAISIIQTQQDAYQKAAQASGIPWLVIACIHFRESGLRFDRHLHNGDPLTDRTVHVPVGRPVASPGWGALPYSWHESAADALSTAWRPAAWSLEAALEFCERYNGLGYRLKHGVNSPYVWSCTEAYGGGLYVADGSFDPKQIDHRPGCAALLKALEVRGVKLDFTA